MSIFQLPMLSVQSSVYRTASLSNGFFGENFGFLDAKFSALSVDSQPRRSLIIRMGGGPRTFPGGVSKWQWKRMQAKKAKQLMKARLCRERQIYEMRKRAELRAAVSELERPWEVVERAPTLFSVQADEQLKVLADRFQKPGGFDMWSENDGPQLFDPVEGLPSTRFFPKGVVHSIKPYAKVTDGGEDLVSGEAGEGIGEYIGRSRRRRQLKGEASSLTEALIDGGDDLPSDSSLNLVINRLEGKPRNGSSSNDGKKPNRRNDRAFSQNGDMDRDRAEKIGNVNRQREIDSGSRERRTDFGSGRRGDSKHAGPGREHKEGRQRVSNGQNEYRRSNGSEKSMRSKSDVYDMSLLRDGSYGF